MSVDFAFLDSGTGGLPYLKYLKTKNPSASCVYVGDTKNFPYGEKSREEIIEKSSGCVKKIIEKCSPKAIVVACNTISVTALEEMRRRFPENSFIGTVPAIKPAAKISKTRKIGLLATNATVNHEYTKKLAADFASDCEVFSRGDAALISFIEHKFYFASEEERFSACRPACDFFREKNCDVIVLACTHFLNMGEYIQKEAGSSIKVVDSREGVTKHAFEVLENLGGEKNSASDDSALYVTGFTEKNDEARYVDFCARNNIRFAGLL